jgi:endoglucanase
MAGRSPTRLWLTFGAILVLIALTFPAAAGAKVKDDSGLYVPKPNPDARAQITDLHRSGAKVDAELIESLVETPQAVWFTKGTPDEVSRSVEATVRRAKGTVPVLVAYNIPFRDCAQFSAGGATNTAEYLAWIEGFAAGIGEAEAIVILEPDGLGIIPWYTPVGAGGPEWCQPSEADPATAASDRFSMLNAAIERLNEQPNVSVYLDGTHSAWLNVGDNASRLIRAGVADAAGFYLNVSNYQYTENSIHYGTWISSCIAYVTSVVPGDFAGCPNQYWNGGPLPSLLAQLYGEWNGVALSNYGVWSDTTTVQDLNTSAINLRYANMLGAIEPTTHFVIDTSRNGLGPWAPPAGVYPDAQDWCNPPDRGAGLRPTLNTGVALVDAYLWVKIPGESDGECTRGLGATGVEDPEWGQVDPAAGLWFPDMALQLARNAVPSL